MLLSVVNNVEVSDFYRNGDKFFYYLTFFMVGLFAAMFLYAALKYAKR
jgi:hypothetical protein